MHMQEKTKKKWRDKHSRFFKKFDVIAIKKIYMPAIFKLNGHLYCVQHYHKVILNRQKIAYWLIFGR